MNERPSVIIEDEIFDPLERIRERQSEQNIVESSPSPQENNSVDTAPIPPEEPAEENNSEESKGIEVIGNGALCICTGATTPEPAKSLTVISQHRVLCNGGSLLVATPEDKTIASITFGTCKLMNNATCTPNINWQNAYSDINILGSLKVLTLESSGMCQTQAGTVQFKTSGQSESVKTSDISGVEAEAASANNPLMNAGDTSIDHSSIEAMNAQAEEAMRKEMEEPKITKHEEGNQQNVKVTGIIPVTYSVNKQNGIVKQPLGNSCTFKAASGGTLTWKVRDENMRVLKESVGAGEITLQFPKKGRYVIEAYRISSYVKDTTQTSDIERNPDGYKNALIVQVSANEIKLKSAKTKYPVNTNVEIKAEKLFNLSADISNLTYQVLQRGTVVDTSMAVITGTSTGATVIFKKEGSYVVSAVSSNGLAVTPTEGITIEQLKVTGVTANKEKKYKARLKENLEFEAQLNYPDTGNNNVKWRVDFSTTDISNKIQKYPAPNTHVTVKPSMSLFSEPGFYHIYAYMNGKSDSIKAVVELTKPIFVDVKWKDINGNNILEIGKRETVFANIQLEGVIGLDLQYDLCSLATNKIFQTDKLKMTTTKAVICAKLSDQVCKELKEGNKLYYKISCKDTSIVIANKTKPSKEFPISYTKKEKISAFAFYTDKSCQEIVTIATYGSTIYARVLTRNLTGKSLEIFIYRKTPGFFYGTNNIELSKSESKVDDEGIAIFEIKISNDWKNKGNDSYVLAVTEKGDPFYKEKGLSNWETNDTAQNEFTIGKDLLFMRFIDEPISDNDGKVLTKIGKAKTNTNRRKNSKCLKCDEDIAIDEFKRMFPAIKSDSDLFKKTVERFKDDNNIDLS